MMKKEKESLKAFIIMPVSTPGESVSLYQNDSEHFNHVLEHIFVPGMAKAGFSPIRPTAKGSDIIHAEIINNLEQSDLVLCDMTCLNPNVFFEFGIRTALDRPICLVADDKTQIVPFDTQIINYHTYKSDIRPWVVESEIERLCAHIQSSIERAPDYNTLWKVFGFTTKGRSSTDIETNQEIRILQMQNKVLSMQLESAAKKTDLPTEVSVQNKPIHRCSRCNYGFTINDPYGPTDGTTFVATTHMYSRSSIPISQLGIYPPAIPERRAVQCPNCGNWDPV